MARHLFGGIPDFVVAPGEEVTIDLGEGPIPANQTLLIPALDVTFWDAPVGGTQHTDLTDLTDTAIAGGIVTTDSDGAWPQYFGPDGVALMYADAGGVRRAVIAVDIGPLAEELRNTINDLTETLAEQSVLLGSSLGVVRYDAGTSSWPNRPADSRVYVWIGPTAPQIGAPFMQDGVDLWLNPTPAG